jgi:hypothetical protein
MMKQVPPAKLATLIAASVAFGVLLNYVKLEPGEQFSILNGLLAVGSAWVSVYFMTRLINRLKAPPHNPRL